MDNSKWFDIKLLVDLTGASFKKPLNNRSYADAIKAVLLFLGIAPLHLLHLGRNLVANILELLEDEN